MALPPLESWQAVNFRVTAFPAERVKTDTLSWWSDLVGHQPETVTSRPKTGQRAEAGELQGRQLLLQVEPERIDWILAPAVTPGEEVVDVLPVAGMFPEVSGVFLETMLRWMPHCPKLTRLALGAVLAQPAEDRKTGYIQIAHYVPGVAAAIDPERSSDFLFQINRPRASTSGVANLAINRLTKWSVLLFQRFHMTLDKSQVTTTGYTAKQSACRLELDINTAPGYSGILPQESLPAILAELFDLAKEIAANGDVP